MISGLFSITNHIYRKHPLPGSYLFKGNKLLINLLYPILQAFNRAPGTDEGSEVVISLTSFPARIRYVSMTILTLLDQTRKPCRVVLWLAEDQFPDKRLPRRLVKLCKRGLEIRYCEDLKSHKKYFYAMQEWPDKYILTCDDDMFYPETLVEDLWRSSRKHPHTVICNTSAEIICSREGKPVLQDDAAQRVGETEGLRVCPIGCGGVLYPPGALSKEVFCREVFTEIALRQDDIWLKCMAVLQGTPSYNEGKYVHNFFNNLYTQKSGLWRTNTAEAGDGTTPNDRAFKHILEKYPEIEITLKNACRKEEDNE